MRADELRAGQVIGPTVVEIEGSFSGEASSFEVEFPRRGAGHRLVLVHNGRPHFVTSLSGEAQLLERLADKAAPTIALAQRIDKHSAFIHTSVFDEEIVSEKQVIYVPDDFVETLLSKLDTESIDDQAVVDEFVISDGGSENRFVIATGLADDIIEIVGRSCRLRVDTTSGLRTVGISSRPSEGKREIFRLVRGSITFTSTNLVENPILGSLTISSAPSFKLWETYNQLELESAKERSSQIGQARHGKPEYRDEVVVLPIRADEDANFLKELSRERSGTEVEIVPQTIGFDTDSRSLDRFIGTVEFVDISGKSITVRPRIDRPGVITNDGLVRPYLGGAAAQAFRRQVVHDRLQRGDHQIEALGYLLREESPPTVIKPGHRVALTSAVRRIIPGTITAAQQRAIDVAINTPDVALIQGPPGTGKSQVIAAIQQRLAELAPDGASRLILLTSVQHDAVDLVAARTNIFGLPARRFAQRRSDIESPIERWRKERLASLRRFNDTQERSALSRWLGDVLDVYEQTPYTSSSAADLLEEVVDRCGSELDTDLRERMEKRSASLRLQRKRPRLDADLRAVRGLRTTVVGHEDDGPQQAERVLRRGLTTFKGWDDLAAPLLERVASGSFEDVAMERIRSMLLDELLRSETIDGATLADEPTRALLMEAKAKINGSRERPLTPEEAIDLFMLDLELDEHGVEQAIAGYTAVWASTCQGSATLFVGDLKLGKISATFPVVIVDEAARANPLDLLIPMVQSGERIILVGDHRQLPQLIDDSIQKKVGATHGDQEALQLEDSLFHRLFRHFEKLEVETGIPRAVTLDVQFRMHPILGDFVSSVFYEPYGEGFQSGRPPEDFEHGVSRFRGRVAAWVNVPEKDGRPTKDGTSLVRTAEAKVVAQLASEILAEAPDLSLGIITFYAAQQERILEELAEFGVTELSEDGISIAEPYRMLETNSGQREERFRVGTVDAFQGKEFDIVILSMVRSGAVKTDATVRETFGFLTSANRTCVALSRQRRLLVIVGDRGLVGLPNADRVRGLVELAELCGEPL